jgi:hypothetical protein
MLQHPASPPVAPPPVAPAFGASMQEVPGTPLPTRRSRFHSRPTTLVVHSRVHAVRFRILVAPAVTDVPVSLHPRHRTCQKAMDCDGDETSDRYQR